MTLDPIHIGMSVHYVSLGDKDGKFPQACRAATITEIRKGAPGNVGLVVLNPTGDFFHPLSAGGCDQQEPAPFTEKDGFDMPSGGTWHRVHPHRDW